MELLTVDEVAQILKLSPYTIREMLKDGRLQGVKMSKRGQWRIRREDLEAYLGK